MRDFRESGFMYLLGTLIVVFVLGQSLFFMRKAWKQGKKIGISSKTMQSTVLSAALFTVAPSLAILATVISLANALGLVLPWIRLSVIGNISYETTAAMSVIEAFGIRSGINAAVTDELVFTAAAWVMTIGSIMPLILMPFLVKRVQKKIGKVAASNAKWADLMAAAAFIGIIAAFIARSINGAGSKEVQGDGAGFSSVITLVSAVGFMLLLQWLCKRFCIKWLEPFAMPLSMFAAMGVAILCSLVLPEAISLHEWRY